ncbi:MAG: rod shape-determining protein MreC [Enterovibrio sp.]
MNPIFGRGPSLQLRLLLALIICTGLMLADKRLDAFSGFRFVLNSVVAPLQYAANMPREVLDGVVQEFSTKQRLLQENRMLRIQSHELRAENLRLSAYEYDNRRLHALLNAPFVRTEHRMLAKVMSIAIDPYRRKIFIDKGRVHGVFEGQPVLNERGVVGKVSDISSHSSVVLLLTDKEHGIAVEVQRNGLRRIANGTGNAHAITLDSVSSSDDVQAGDLLVTSGLGGVFPEGYPVATVKSVVSDNSRPFSDIVLTPQVDFDQLPYVLLVWSDNVKKQGQLIDEINSEQQQLQETEK